MAIEQSLRTRRLFRSSGRALVVAMDHSRSYRTVTGLKDGNKIIEEVIGAGADAIIAPRGTVAGAAEVIGTGGVWLSVDATPATSPALVESAVQLGADGIKVEVYPWCQPDDEFFRRYSGAESILNTNVLKAECQKLGMPLLVESIPFGWLAADERTPELIAAASRVASEAGADYVKTFYTGDKTSFKTLTENCTVPVLILGGAKADSDRDVLVMVRDAMDSGAVGIAMGRNIWGHANVAGMTAALAAIIHDDASVETAYRHID
jgi:DhnA family fructose-bisphosphate aldolase class Ia